MTVRTSRIGLATALVAVAISACDDDPADLDPPTTGEVAGVYLAADDVGVFTAEDSTGTVKDLLDEGASVDLELENDGTTTGELILPPNTAGGEELVADLTGTWTHDGFIVTLHNDSETLFDGLELIWVAGGLLASGSMGDGSAFELELFENSN